MLLREFGKRREKTQTLTTHKTFMKTHIVQIIYDIISKESLLFELQGVGSVNLNDENSLQFDKKD